MSNCFVVMPFRPELQYMYLSVKEHIETTFPGVSCERGDDTILTRPILEKIAAYIKKADIVIADCTGRNANVFYELGMAHALEKPVILITADEVQDAPTDIRAFEFIRYIEGPKPFFEKLDLAIRKLVGNPFDEFYDRALPLFDEFRAGQKLAIQAVNREQFAAVAAVKVRVTGFPKPGDEKTLATMFLPILVNGPADLDIMLKIKEWIQQRFPN
jgi:hypothetical protein